MLAAAGLTGIDSTQCNLERPSCAQCKKAGLKCAGYDTQRVFVVSTPSSRRIGYTVSASPAQPDSWQRGTPNRGSSPSIDDYQLLARPEQERRCIEIFWEAYFPSGRPLPTVVSRSYTCGWTETARTLYREDDSLRYAMWANCLFTTGRRTGTTWMMEDAFKLYGAALYNLRRSLGASAGVRRDSLIATVKLLSLFEVRTRSLLPSQAVTVPGLLTVYRLRCVANRNIPLLGPRTGRDIMLANSHYSSLERPWHTRKARPIIYSRTKE